MSHGFADFVPQNAPRFCSLNTCMSKFYFQTCQAPVLDDLGIENRDSNGNVITAAHYYPTLNGRLLPDAWTERDFQEFQHTMIHRDAFELVCDELEKAIPIIEEHETLIDAINRLSDDNFKIRLVMIMPELRGRIQ